MSLRKLTSFALCAAWTFCTFTKLFGIAIIRHIVFAVFLRDRAGLSPISLRQDLLCLLLGNDREIAWGFLYPLLLGEFNEFRFWAEGVLFARIACLKLSEVLAMRTAWRGQLSGLLQVFFLGRECVPCSILGSIVKIHFGWPLRGQ